MVKVIVINQDNTSMMKLAQNGKASSGKRTSNFDIKLFFVTDLIHQDVRIVKCCPTDDMIVEYNRTISEQQVKGIRRLDYESFWYHPSGCPAGVCLA